MGSASRLPQDAAEVREIPAGQTQLVYRCMRELRPHVGPTSEFVALVDHVLRPEGYRLVGLLLPGVPDAVAVAGFRVQHLIARGRSVYVDDLVTRPEFRRQGHADQLMAWLIAEARRLDCDEFHLDSALHRHDAHRFYLAHRMDITAFHFALEPKDREGPPDGG
jgi:GNAT superfamily N-acetyltransferase